MSDSGPRRIGVSIEVKPHAYDPVANPELFEGVLKVAVDEAVRGGRKPPFGQA